MTATTAPRVRSVGIRDVYGHLAALFYDNPWLDQTDNIRVTVQEITRERGSFAQRFVAAMASKGCHPRIPSENHIEIDGLLECIHENWISDAGPGMKTGIYDHFKGGIYRVEKVSTFGDGQPVIVYLSMTTGVDYCRYCHEWPEIVRWPDGKYRSRYIYRGPTLETPAPSFKVKEG